MDDSQLTWLIQRALESSFVGMNQVLPDVEKKVTELLARGVMDEAVKRHADALLAQLRGGLKV